jgi:hypothetical protein
VIRNTAKNEVTEIWVNHASTGLTPSMSKTGSPSIGIDIKKDVVLLKRIIPAINIY